MAWNIDNAHSMVEFSVRHMMISTVRGRFTAFSGTVSADPDNQLKSSVLGSVQAASIDTHDGNRDAHLRSADFFDAEKYPTLDFFSKRIEKTDDETYRVTGDLTIRDTTREVAFEVTDNGKGKDPWGNTRWGLEATTAINRKDFGLTWNVGLETGGWLVGDQVKIHAEIELVYVPEKAAETA